MADASTYSDLNKDPIQRTIQGLNLVVYSVFLSSLFMGLAGVTISYGVHQYASNPKVALQIQKQIMNWMQLVPTFALLVTIHGITIVTRSITMHTNQYEKLKQAIQIILAAHFIFKCINVGNTLFLRIDNTYALVLLRYLSYFLWWAFLILSQVYVLIELNHRQGKDGTRFSKLMLGYSALLLAYERIIPFVYRYVILEQRSYRWIYLFPILRTGAVLLFAVGMLMLHRKLTQQIRQDGFPGDARVAEIFR